MHQLSLAILQEYMPCRLHLDGAAVEFCREKSKKNRCVGSNAVTYEYWCAQIQDRAKKLEDDVSHVCYDCVREGKLRETETCKHKSVA